MWYKLIRYIVLATRLDKKELCLLANDLCQLGVFSVGAAIAGLLLQQTALAFPLFLTGCIIWYVGVWLRRWSNRR